jgi:hypothetical protein
MPERFERVSFEEVTGLGKLQPGQVIKVTRTPNDPPLRIVVRETMRMFAQQGYEVSAARLYNKRFRTSPDEYYLVVTRVTPAKVKEVPVHAWRSRSSV